ncbi:Iron/zinc purple acid phosphatase-like protein [Strongyloides ratti]|uniref:Purple acid phosphatase n=1 Tax=Strongyloides ratti TaxID=34506 RepID=A0A090LJA9_STRRB|nr:Iron/zinc purple acid phosphatase-like protein [Strongyloides ratti]CEF69793.1 Iron/zinc purple acid phosphatase-like protein [Strongyloides ratti]
MNGNEEEEEPLLDECNRAEFMLEEQKPYKNVALFISLNLLFFETTAEKNNNFSEGHQQVHISLAKDYQSLMVSWVTFFDLSAMNKTPTVAYGVNNKTLNLTKSGSTEVFKHMTGNITRYFHKVILTDLSFDTTYYYKVGDGSTWSKIFHFHTFPSNSNNDIKICVLGDMDAGKNFTIIALTKAVSEKKCQLILHIGDIAYQLQKDDGLIGDDFMRQIEPIAAYVPYMVIDGNHEFDCYGFSHYEKRFAMPIEANKTSDLDHYYSFTIGPINFIALSSEIYGFYAVYGPDPIKRQGKWLKNELERIKKDKENHPWTIAYLHRPLYCYTKYHVDECNEYENSMIRRGYNDMPGLEEYFHDYNVDLVFYGHEHIYQRNYPVYNRTVYEYKDNIYHNPPATTYVLSGSGGCLRCTVEDEVDNNTVLPFGVFSSNQIGYTLVHVLNFTHINVSHISSKDDHIIDSFTIVKDIGYTMDKKTNDTPKGIYKPFELSKPNYPYLKPTNILLWCLDNTNMSLYEDRLIQNRSTTKKITIHINESATSRYPSISILYFAGVVIICAILNM